MGALNRTDTGRKPGPEDFSPQRPPTLMDLGVLPGRCSHQPRHHRDVQQAADLFSLQTFGNIYSRIGNPTNAAFEERMAALEGGLGPVSTASGQSAQLIALLTLARGGDHVVSSNALYGATYTQLDVTLRRLGIETTFVDFSHPDLVEQAI